MEGNGAAPNEKELKLFGPRVGLPNSTAAYKVIQGEGVGQGEMEKESDSSFSRQKESQSIVVTGESGPGKTESQKAVLRYLCENWGGEAGPIQQRILQTDPILEAFGNAKMLRNNNSSRFGKFVEIHFEPSGGKVVGGLVRHYLLEKSRLCHQNDGERNYHIFYQLIAGSDPKTYARLGLAPPDQFNYLRHGCDQFFGNSSSSRIDPARMSKKSRSDGLMPDASVDDARDYLKLCDALQGAGLSPAQVDVLWGTVAALLHLGNICFEEIVDDNRGGCRISMKSADTLQKAAKLLGLELQELQMSLVSRIMQATMGGVEGTLARVPLKTYEAAAGRDALAKAIYGRLFDWLVAAINRSVNEESDGKGTEGTTYIGVLDFPGFESFTVNSFEQFCINYCNEKLQYFFNERILKQEQELYEKEGLSVPRIEYSDNTDCIELFERKTNGLLDLLDEEARLPRATPQHYTTAVMEANKGHFRLETPRKSKLRAHRDMRDEEGFLVRHYAGTVCYQTQQFLEKNNDQLHNSLEMLVEQSSVPFLRSLFEMSSGQQNGAKSSTKLKAASVESKIRGQLNVLIEKLTDTGTHFVWCVKPNATMSLGSLEAPAVLEKVSSRLRITRWKKAIYGVWMVIKLKNKILYRAEQTRRIQSLIRGYLVRRRVQQRLELYRRVVNLRQSAKEMTEIVAGMKEQGSATWRQPVASSLQDLDQLVKEIKMGVELQKATSLYEQSARRVDEMIARLMDEVEQEKPK